MSKNYSSTGDTVTFVAPTGGAVAGVPVALNDLVVVPLQSGAKGAQLVGRTGGAWNVPAAAGLKQGQKVGILNGGLVPAATADAVYCGKLTSEVVGGVAEFLLIQ
ncbi:capsid cement protein [Pseudomonas viridiflava]|uniref:capsid cement protein n=1 Tax=Pseudomonas viridiflava TaxID=33069 RepID=UPI000F0255A4|nr:capsid cement protein [Pseudomonas viridiflava]